MTLDPGPMRVIRAAFSTKAEVLDDVKSLDFWPTTYVSDRMEELPLHWHDFDNVGYVLEGRTYVLNEKLERVALGPGDKLILPRGAIHAEGEVTEKTVYIVGLPMAANLFDVLIDLKDPVTSPVPADGEDSS
jgi:mannose-6-phosphate isomerase-like protein (cupin superfamily)